MQFAREHEGGGGFSPRDRTFSFSERTSIYIISCTIIEVVAYNIDTAPDIDYCSVYVYQTPTRVCTHTHTLTVL